MIIKKKLISLCLALLLACSSVSGTYAASKAELQAKLQNIEQELIQLDNKNKSKTKDKNDLSKELKLVEEKYQTNIDLIKSEQQQIKECESKILEKENNIQKYKSEIQVKNDAIQDTQIAFDSAKNDYYERLRNIYMTGSQYESFLILLEADGLQDLLTKYQVIATYNKRTACILNNFNKKKAKLEKEKKALSKKNNKLKEERISLQLEQNRLIATQKSLKQSKEELKSEEKIITAKKTDLENEIISIAEKTHQYSELRAQTAEELAEIDAEIAKADKKYPQKKPATTKPKPTKVETDKKEETTIPSYEVETSKPNNGTSDFEGADAPSSDEDSPYIRLTYPVPSQKRITCEYMGYSGHTGCDFSTFGKVNQKIVASESGTVIISKDLTNSNGSYRSYGRYIVIRHDKLTKSGKTVYTLYAHNNSRLVNAGEHVSKGQTIALSGSTGNSTGPHCHFEVRVGGATQSYAVDPRDYLFD